jgi:hypothetical protein
LQLHVALSVKSGRCRRLPARTPLRTVRESFPSYGSSPHKAASFSGWSDPLSDQRAAWQYGQAAALVVLRGASTPGRINRRESVVICFLRFMCGSTCSLAIADPTDVSISSALPLALAFSVIPLRHPLTRLAVRSARSGTGLGAAAFPCSARFTG